MLHSLYNPIFCVVQYKIRTHTHTYIYIICIIHLSLLYTAICSRGFFQQTQKAPQQKVKESSGRRSFSTDFQVEPSSFSYLSQVTLGQKHTWPQTQWHKKTCWPVFFFELLLVLAVVVVCCCCCCCCRCCWRNQWLCEIGRDFTRKTLTCCCGKSTGESISSVWFVAWCHRTLARRFMSVHMNGTWNPPKWKGNSSELNHQFKDSSRFFFGGVKGFAKVSLKNYTRPGGKGRQTAPRPFMKTPAFIR